MLEVYLIEYLDDEEENQSYIIIRVKGTNVIIDEGGLNKQKAERVLDAYWECDEHYNITLLGDL